MCGAKDARAICFEKDESRCANIALNKNNLGVPTLSVIQGSALEKLQNQPQPNAIFLGSDVANEQLFNACWKALKPGGRLVANAVTLASQNALFARQQSHGGVLVSIAISTLHTIGSSPVMRPALPVMQWVLTKGYAQ